MKGDSAKEEQGTPPAESIKEELQGRCQEQRGCPITGERQPYRQDPTAGEVPREGTQGWGKHQGPARASEEAQAEVEVQEASGESREDQAKRG